MNTVNLVGRLTRDPELSTTNSGMKYCRFSVAVDRRFKNKDGEYEADFPSIIAWDKTAEFVDKYFRKGQRIGIVGRIQTGKYESQEGHTVYTTDVVAENVEFVESKNASGDNTYATTAQPDTSASLPFDL